MLQATSAKACKVCGAGFVPFLSTQVVCGVKCATKVPKLARKEAKDDRKRTREKLADMKPLSHWVKQAQVAFNAWIRARDANLPCISCGRNHQGAHDAGHYLSTGARPELRFDEANCHRQCVPCNQHRHGDVARYRVGLIERTGLANVERLEGPHPPRKWNRDELKALTADYRARLRAMKA